MAPEIFDGDENYGPTCDIYSLGMCILEMATLRTPYSECKNPGQVCRKVTKGEKPESFFLIENEDLKEFIGKCLAKVNDRPTAETLLKEKFYLF